LMIFSVRFEHVVIKHFASKSLTRRGRQNNPEEP